MSDEHPQPGMSTRWLMISASGLSVVTGPDLARDVAIHLHIPENQLGLAPGVGLALRMTPAEARKFADTLRRKANEAEAGLPRS
jgi:hypothetical protein